MSTQTSTSDNRLLALVQRHGLRLAQVIGRGTIQPEHWPAVHLAMLGAIDDAAVTALAPERRELTLIGDWLQRNCADRRLVSAPISDQVMDLIAWQQDQLEMVMTANKRQETRIAALLTTIHAQDEEIARCSTKPAPSTPITVTMALSAPGANGTLPAVDPMPQPESTPASTGDEDIAISALPASGRSRTREEQPYRYTAEMKAELQAKVVDRLRTLLAERSTETMSSHDFQAENADLPLVSSFTKTLGMRWSEFVTLAGGVPLAPGQAGMQDGKARRKAQEATAAIPVAVPFSGANGAGE